ncbi:SGNH hydrolase-type esterase domain-containing protein [Dactylonectria macrodidyma]|uniref:SGNH hydrolase-type esterase domain-containing protein n=1 Tax=Dactylonectria macrodidyma TaxID=307937 RepID=A0A9P9DZ70_9HYPO|nr:SGNH hydrolase-type esterase domain-containing protein [Dactylonectria macrodidyma]
MKFVSVSLALATVLGFSQAAPAVHHKKPPYFILTGDSTVAINGGWGNGFLSVLKSGADGINRGKSGATTVSFRNQGRWNSTLEDVETYKDDYRPIVTIQFGHNDQKTSANISLDEFRTNLEVMANEVKEAGGTPILITSLTRRTFDGDEVRQNLKDQRNQTILAAKAVGAKYLDLNLASTNYINAIGQENADYYNSREGDRTHLNPAGETVFGRMVADLLLRKRRDLTKYVTPNLALSEKIWAGEFATGDE